MSVTIKEKPVTKVNSELRTFKFEGDVKPALFLRVMYSANNHIADVLERVKDATDLEELVNLLNESTFGTVKLIESLDKEVVNVQVTHPITPICLSSINVYRKPVTGEETTRLGNLNIVGYNPCR